MPDTRTILIAVLLALVLVCVTFLVYAQRLDAEHFLAAMTLIAGWIVPGPSLKR